MHIRNADAKTVTYLYTNGGVLVVASVLVAGISVRILEYLTLPVLCKYLIRQEATDCRRVCQAVRNSNDCLNFLVRTACAIKTGLGPVPFFALPD